MMTLHLPQSVLSQLQLGPQASGAEVLGQLEVAMQRRRGDSASRRQPHAQAVPEPPAQPPVDAAALKADAAVRLLADEQPIGRETTTAKEDAALNLLLNRGRL